MEGDRSGNNQGKLKVGLPCDVGLFGPSYADRKDRFRFLADGGIAGSPRLEPMISASNATDAAVIEAFAKIPALLDQTPALIVRGRFLDCECLLGPINHTFHASIRQGRIVDLTPSPVLMRSWRFSYRASVAAWAEYWRPAPRPGFHDLLALTKRGEAVLEGDLHPFMTHLQYFKDVLALPRHFATVVS
jgi:hypothetical protein